MPLGNRYLALLALTVVYGGTFALIEVVIRAFEPEGILALRMILAMLTVAPFAIARTGLRETVATIRSHWWKMLLGALFTFTLPTLGLTWAQTRIDSGLTGVLIAGAPLFTAVLALRFARGDTVTGSRLVGLLVGFAGVALLVGAQPSGDVLAALAVAGVGLSYACASLVTSRWLSGISPFVATLGMFVLTALVAIPVAIPRLPDAVPGAGVVAAMIGLGVLCTGIALTVYVAVVSRHGPQLGILVNYTVPGAALVIGALFLDETITAVRLGGLALVLLGVGIASGLIRRRAAAGRTA